MKILFFGDLVGKPARNVLGQILPVYKDKYRPDLIIANGDNLAHGKGVTKSTVTEVIKSGVDIITCGDHIWDTSEAVNLLENKKYNLLCPANFPVMDYKKGHRMIKVGAKEVLVINLAGRVFFQKCPDSPFKVADEIIKNNKADVVIVDFHAEATSEKKALGFYLDGKVSAVLGTHTHVQTSDEEILSGGTAYISDVGMVGPKDSILGCKKNTVIEQMFTQMPFRYELSGDSDVLVNGVLVDINGANGKAEKIQRINEVVKNVV